MTQLTEQEIRVAFAEVSKRAELSAEFRNRVLDNAAAVLREVLGREIPDGMGLQIVELESGELEMYLSDPSQPEDLNDGELEQVSGGGVRPCWRL